MKIVTKFAVAALLAISAVVPAFAFEAESQTLDERNSYIYTPDSGSAARHAQSGRARGNDVPQDVDNSAPYNGNSN
jgi:hypothetical protein